MDYTTRIVQFFLFDNSTLIVHYFYDSGNGYGMNATSGVLIIGNDSNEIGFAGKIKDFRFYY